MARPSKQDKKDKKLIEYGNEKQTIPVLIPDKRYRALKTLSLQRGKPLNQIVRDTIEAMYKEDLDAIEETIDDPSGQHESTLSSFNADARLRVSA